MSPASCPAIEGTDVVTIPACTKRRSAASSVRGESPARVEYDMNLKSASGPGKGGVQNANLGGDAGNEQYLATGFHDRIARFRVQKDVCRRPGVQRHDPEGFFDLRNDLWDS